jgi:hypothetical protein
MGAHLIVTASTLFLQLPQQDSIPKTEQPSAGIAYERLSDALRYDRVEGLSVGLGYRLPLSTSRRLASAYATLRYGVSDERVTWRLSVQRDLAKGRVTASGYHDLANVDPFSQGHSISNTLNALIVGHDNGDYADVQGGALLWETAIAPTLELGIGGRVERQRSVGTIARSAINDFLGGTGIFPPNTPVRPATLSAITARITGVDQIKWNLTAEVLAASERTVARLYGGVRLGFGSLPAISFRLKGGGGGEPSLPQTLFRLGGLATVRGFEYATVQGPAFWAAQMELGFGRGRVRPLAFLDGGQAARLADFGSTRALVGVGVGLSVLRGLIRFDLSRPLSPDNTHRLRFDLVLGRIE